jgi:hypothetical protein
MRDENELNLLDCRTADGYVRAIFRTSNIDAEQPMVCVLKERGPTIAMFTTRGAL